MPHWGALAEKDGSSRKLILVWDRWNVHRLAARRLSRYRWLQIEWLPSYAPELNPVKSMWNHRSTATWSISFPTMPGTLAEPFDPRSQTSVTMRI